MVSILISFPALCHGLIALQSLWLVWNRGGDCQRQQIREASGILISKPQDVIITNRQIDAFRHEHIISRRFRCFGRFLGLLCRSLGRIGGLLRRIGRLDSRCAGGSRLLRCWGGCAGGLGTRCRRANRRRDLSGDKGSWCACIDEVANPRRRRRDAGCDCRS